MCQAFSVYNKHRSEICNLKEPFYKKGGGHLNGRRQSLCGKTLLVKGVKGTGLSLQNNDWLIWLATKYFGLFWTHLGIYKKSCYVHTSSSHFVLIFSKWKKYHRSTSIPTLQAVVSRDSTSRGLIGQSDHNCQKTFGTKWQHSFNL